MLMRKSSEEGARAAVTVPHKCKAECPNEIKIVIVIVSEEEFEGSLTTNSIDYTILKLGECKLNGFGWGNLNEGKRLNLITYRLRN